MMGWKIPVAEHHKLCAALQHNHSVLAQAVSLIYWEVTRYMGAGVREFSSGPRPLLCTPYPQTSALLTLTPWTPHPWTSSGSTTLSPGGRSKGCKGGGGTGCRGGGGKGCRGGGGTGCRGGGGKGCRGGGVRGAEGWVRGSRGRGGKGCMGVSGAGGGGGGG